MSWDISLEVDGVPVDVERHIEGGTYAVGGVSQAKLNVTYNYSVMFDFKKLDGMLGSSSGILLNTFVKTWGTKQYDDYWAPTPGNIGYACNILLTWAQKYPNAVWKVE